MAPEINTISFIMMTVVVQGSVEEFTFCHIFVYVSSIRTQVDCTEFTQRSKSEEIIRKYKYGYVHVLLNFSIKIDVTLEIFDLYFTQVFFDPLTPMTEQDRISPYQYTLPIHYQADNKQE